MPNLFHNGVWRTRLDGGAVQLFHEGFLREGSDSPDLFDKIFSLGTAEILNRLGLLSFVADAEIKRRRKEKREERRGGRD